MSEIDDVCVVTQPIAKASKSHVHDLLRILAVLTTPVLITANLSRESDQWEDYEIINISSSGSGDTIVISAVRFLLNQIRMSRVIVRRNERTVLFFGATSYFLPVLAAKLSGKTVIIEPRGNVPLTLRLYWEKRIPKSVARVLAGSLKLLEQINYTVSDKIITYTPAMAQELGLDAFEEKLYPQGARFVDTDQFTPKISFDDRNQVIGFLGRLDEEKGIDTLAKVARQLPEDVTFRFIGDGSKREWLETTLSEEIAAGKVEVTGWVDHKNVPDELNKLKLLVMPSAPTEGLPTTILESMACGTPVYATPVSGIPDVVMEGQTGFRLESLDPKEIGEDVQSILNRSDLSNISDEARKTIEEEYSFQASVIRYRRILESE